MTAAPTTDQQTRRPTVSIEQLALKIAKEQGSDALDDWMGLGEMLENYDLDGYETDALAELVRSIHREAWQLYAERLAHLAESKETP